MSSRKSTQSSFVEVLAEEGSHCEFFKLLALRRRLVRVDASLDVCSKISDENKKIVESRYICL